MQVATIEFARNVCGLEAADSTEFNAGTPHRVIFKLRELKGIEELSQQLRRIADIEWPVTVEPLPGDAPGDPDPGLGWRTRVTFAVRSVGLAGLRAHRSHRVVEIDDCLIANPRVRDLGVPGRHWPRARSDSASYQRQASRRFGTA